MENVREEVFEDPVTGVTGELGDGITWLDFDGIPDPAVMENVGRKFQLHPLVLEDILNTRQRSKIEDHGDCLFIVLKALRFDQAAREVRPEQISVVFGKNYLLSFREGPGDLIDPIYARLHAGKGALRKSGPDYLAYALIDTVVDHYFLALEKIGDAIERVESQILEESEAEALRVVYQLKQTMISTRKSVWPLREVINRLLRDDSELVRPGTKIFLRDVYDHTIQVVEGVESTRDTLSGLLDLYLSMTSNRMNEVMKVLTIIATIFIPLTFVAGIYGMNFEYMPELAVRWAYPAVWVVMGVVAAIMLVAFKRKGWL